MLSMEDESEMSQAQMSQLRADIGFARDQILSFLGAENPGAAPAMIDHDTAVLLENARRSDISFAVDQIVAAIRTTPLSDTDIDRIAQKVAGLISPVERAAPKKDKKARRSGKKNPLKDVA
jgi:hypothetical protein